MDKYSTFALPESERRGYVLLCRTRAYSDLEIELENDRAHAGIGYPGPDGRSYGEISMLTHDIRRLVLAGRSARVCLDYRPVCRDHDSRNRRNPLLFLSNVGTSVPPPTTSWNS